MHDADWKEYLWDAYFMLGKWREFVAPEVFPAELQMTDSERKPLLKG